MGTRTCKVLLIEDDPICAKMESIFLESVGFEVTLKETGMSGIGAAIKDSYDVVITDMDLPDCKGDQVSRAINNYYNGSIPIFSISSNPAYFKSQMSHDGISCRLQKPFNSKLARQIKYMVENKI